MRAFTRHNLALPSDHGLRQILLIIGLFHLTQRDGGGNLDMDRRQGSEAIGSWQVMVKNLWHDQEKASGIELDTLEDKRAACN